MKDSVEHINQVPRWQSKSKEWDTIGRPWSEIVSIMLRGATSARFTVILYINRQIHCTLQ
ncbi:hypothetical protein MA16_Dca014964 [Dendrobium catenatum]|uniref:Uncharacterized protein n=1 Tax=Dendrobium catenatum TaxID=906689 RepID=A0A2I0V9J0_9ASPA|nr:hypothetical protein MA16_Dca014964 [Dendrobium catenatum]